MSNTLMAYKAQYYELSNVIMKAHGDTHVMSHSQEGVTLYRRRWWLLQEPPNILSPGLNLLALVKDSTDEKMVWWIFELYWPLPTHRRLDLWFILIKRERDGVEIEFPGDKWFTIQDYAAIYSECKISRDQ